MELLHCSYDEIRAISIRIKTKQLDGIETPDSGSERLLDHLCGCLECLMTIIKHRGPLCYTGCAEFLELLKRENTRIDLARSPLANLHFTAEMIEEYSFNRLSFLEAKAFEAHVTVCRDCAQKLEHRRQFIALIQSALKLERAARPQGVRGVFAFDERTQRTSEADISGL